MRIFDLDRLGDCRGLLGKLLFGLILLLTIWHSRSFLIGYRLTADEVYFAYIAMQGFETVIDTSRWIAEGQGRIGFLFLQPINMFAALMSEFLAWRVIFVALYMLMVWTAFAYAERLLKLSIAPLAFLVFLALHPLAFEHLPPTAYPLQNTLPFLVLFTCRLMALTYEKRKGWMVVNRLLQGIALLTTEFALLLGLVMMFAELLARHPLGISTLKTWFMAVFKDRQARLDLATVGVVVGLYVAYRLAHPSLYEGNSLQGVGNVDAMAYTTWRHIVDGLVVPRIGSELLQAPWWIWIGALVSGVGMYVALRLTMRIVGMKRTNLFGVTAFLLAAMVFVTLPVSASLKQQGWCLDPGHCAYLDSRTTILGVVLLCVFLMNALLFALANTFSARMLRRVIGGVFASVFAMGGLHNWQVAQEMASYSEVWQEARTLACVPHLVPDEADALYALIDPGGLIPFHEADAPLRFWPLYLEWARNADDCAKAAVLTRSLTKSYLPVLHLDAVQTIGGKYGKKYLGTGWSKIESWGVWSHSKEAEITFHTPNLKPGERALLRLDAHMYLDSEITSQRLTIRQDGQTLWEGVRGLEGQNQDFIIPLLPYDPAQEIITLTLIMPDAQVPSASGDTRALGIGLKGLMLLEK